MTCRNPLQIAAGLRGGLTFAATGRRIERPTSTVTREVMSSGRDPRIMDEVNAQSTDQTVQAGLRT